MLPARSPESYLAGRTSVERRDTGEVYTPRAAADFVLERCRYPGTAGETVLDPAAGCGAFLEAAQARRLSRARRVHNLMELAPARAFIRQLEVELHGVDISDQAVTIARARLRDALEGHVHPTAVKEYEPDIAVADFLSTAPYADAWPARWPRAGFDLVVGNPPYVQLARLNVGTREALRARYKSAVGRFDLYAVFLEAAVGLLGQERGRLGFVVPNRLLTTRAAHGIRTLLNESLAIEEIFDFHEAKLFAEEVDAYPLILIASRGPRRDVSFYRFTSRHESPIDAVRSAIQNARAKPRSLRLIHVDRAELAKDEWNFDEPRHAVLKRKIEAAGPPLREQALAWGIGTATGRDQRFVVKQDLAARLEPGLLRPTIRGRDVKPFHIEDPKLSLIVPYEADASGKRVLAKASEYPHVFGYLALYREELERRSCVTRAKQTKKWFEHHESIDVELAKRTKIVWPDVAGTNSFALDRGSYHPLHSVYFLIPRANDDALVGLLNSTPAEFFLKTQMPRVNGGHYRYQTRFVERLPIPKLDPAAASAFAAAARIRDRSKCDQLAATAYGLLQDELEFMTQALKTTL